MKNWSVEINGKDKNKSQQLMRRAPSGMEVILAEDMFVQLGRAEPHGADVF